MTQNPSDVPEGTTAAPSAQSYVHVAQLSDLLAEARRYPTGISRADLVETLSLGRNAVDRRLRTALDLGLLVDAGRGPSTGGRAPATWRFNPAGGTVLVLRISYSSSLAALTDLGGQVIDRVDWDQGMFDHPTDFLPSAVKHLRELAARHPQAHPWGLGVSIPLPVDFRDGTLIDPISVALGEDNPWTHVDLRRRLAVALEMSVWVDDEVNMMSLAAATRRGAPPDLLYVRFGLGLGMGIVSGGRVHRGIGATSGEIAHIQVSGASRRRCRCGRTGCLETYVSGGAFQEVAARPEALRHSKHLKAAMDDHGRITPEDVFAGVAGGDRVCVRIATESADKLAGVLAVLATTYNPGEIVIGGAVTESGDLMASIIGQALRRRVLPNTSQRLRVRMGGRHQADEITGTARLVTNSLLAPHPLFDWLPHGHPAGVRKLIEHRRQDA